MPNSPPTHKPSFAPARKERDDLYRRRRTDKAEQAFYQSKRWKQVRASKLIDNPLCEECQRNGRIEAATHVHHKQEIKAVPELRFEPDNFESLCASCHSRHHAEKQHD